MKCTQQLVSHNGLQIPLPLMLQYGLSPGTTVAIEFDSDMIRIIPKLPDQDDIENRSLRLLLKSVGDAVTVKANLLDIAEPDRKVGDWRVRVYARGFDQALGYLDYNKNGELLSHHPSVIEKVRQNATILSQ